jgi:hypothetical protein
LILKYRLPPGTGGGRRRIYGLGRSNLSVQWGLSRHEWGEIHFCLALALVGLIAIHLWLHWNWVCRVFSPRGQDEGWSCPTGRRDVYS